MPSFYSSAMLSGHLFVKHKFKSHKFCSYARNFRLPSIYAFLEDVILLPKVLSQATPFLWVWDIKHVCIPYQPECIMTGPKEIKSYVYFPNESKECFPWQQTYANILCVCQVSAPCEQLPVEASKPTFLILTSYLIHLFHLFFSSSTLPAPTSTANSGSE